MLDNSPDQSTSGDTSETKCNSPETRLMLAVLQDAFAVFQSGLKSTDGRDVEAFREVDRWFRSRDFDSPFSFESICSTIGISAGCFRDGLNQLKRNTLVTGTLTKKRMLSRQRYYPARTSKRSARLDAATGQPG